MTRTTLNGLDRAKVSAAEKLQMLGYSITLLDGTKWWYRGRGHGWVLRP